MPVAAAKRGVYAVWGRESGACKMGGKKQATPFKGSNCRPTHLFVEEEGVCAHLGQLVPLHARVVGAKRGGDCGVPVPQFFACGAHPHAQQRITHLLRGRPLLGVIIRRRKRL